MHAQSSDDSGSVLGGWRRPVQVIVVSSVMFTFISYWRTAAVVLCDLASTAYYIGGIVEGAIGPAAPWFILAVMLFSYAVRSIYIESCSLFVRGGVYRVVKEAMGGFLAKLSVSALMFDYVLTGPISSVSAGQYIMGLLVEAAGYVFPGLHLTPETKDAIRNGGAVAIACAVTLYFFRQNILGIHESSSKALKIMIVTTIMAVVMLGWCGLTLCFHRPVNKIPLAPDLHPKVEYQVVDGRDRVTGERREMWQRDLATGRLVPKPMRDSKGKIVRDSQGEPVPVPKRNEATGRQEDPLGLLARSPSLARQLRDPRSWLSFIGLIGILLAFGHSILAMSGEETLAQVYREVESPKLPNFKKAAFVVFVYSLVLTAGISFLAVLLIPDEVRMKDYSDNLIGGLAMHVVGPPLARLALNAFVVVVGFLILAGAVNTAIIGSNGVLNRVAEDGVLPDWFLKPHSRYGTTYRVLYLIVGLQLLVILISRGDMYVLGEAYAFGVVWSFVFKALAMIVLRFRDRTPREFKVPFNLKIGGVELPIGLGVVFLILLATAGLNFFTKEVATLGGVAFTAVFLGIFIASEHYHERRRGAGGHHKHLEQFNVHSDQEITPAMLGLAKPYRKLVAIRSTQNLFMLEQALAETDPDTTDVIVMTAHRSPRGDISTVGPNLDYYDRELMTAVVERAEKAGKEVRPLILPTNNPLFAVVQTARNLEVQELILGASNLFTADAQLDQVALYWIELHGGQPRPLTVRLLSRSRDIYFDLGGGNRIPKISERRARSVAELRAAGVGVRRVLLVHSATAEGSDLFGAVLTMLDPLVLLTVVPVTSADQAEPSSWLEHDLERARQLHREVEVCSLPGQALAAEIVKRARDFGCDLVIVGAGIQQETATPLDVPRLLHEAPCRVALISSPSLPEELDATPPETQPGKRRV